ncbi:MAG: polyribonucleotide nucleotidyltransferase [Planctomycetota bacterium]
MAYSVEREIGGRKLTIETGKVARQAAGAVIVTYGETVIIAAVSDTKPRPGFDFFPMTVDYRERGYAAGMIFGGRFRKREGPPNEKEILTMRMIDRPVRPLWPDGYMRDILISIVVLSADPENDPDIPAMVGASAALSVSKLPWQGPTGSVRVGQVDGELVLNPNHKQREESKLDLVVSARKGALVMVEAGADELPEDVIIEALVKAQAATDEIVDMIGELVEKVGVEKQVVEPPPTDLADKLAGEYLERVKEAAKTPTKFGRRDAINAVKEEAVEKHAAPEGAEGAEGPTTKEVSGAFGEVKARAVRETILSGERIDGRSLDEVRPITGEVQFLPWVHGSSLFTRGETQAIVTTTLGSTGDEQLIETLKGEFSLRFLLHYNFPSFCVGEVKMPRGPSRREIGHGHLALRALRPVLPTFEDFPYTIRVVSEITESNGSSSMATVCGGTLCMMDSGVPIKDPVAGVAMGLVKDGENVRILTDILGDEDHYGDMDFKVAGTQYGVTALQMDIKTDGIDAEVLKRALAQAREGRVHILGEMLKILDRPRQSPPDHAPKIIIMKIDPDKIGKVIGPGGKMIKGIVERTGAQVNVEDDGTVVIAAVDRAGGEAARAEIEGITATPKINQIYEGTVRSVRDFGAFVEILPGQDGMVHISEFSHKHVKDINEVVKVGDSLRVKCIKIDDMGRIRLSRKAILNPDGTEKE